MGVVGLQGGRNRALAAALLLLVALLSGCVKTAQEIAIDENGMASITFWVFGNETLAGDELRLFAWQLQQLVPQLHTDYDHRSYIQQSGYDKILVYEWKSKEKISLTDIRGASWRDLGGSYVFELSLSPVFDEVSDDSRNNVVMEIQVIMPKEIDIANTTLTSGNTARWVITKEQLLQPITLKAITK